MQELDQLDQAVEALTEAEQSSQGEVDQIQKLLAAKGDTPELRSLLKQAEDQRRERAVLLTRCLRERNQVRAIYRLLRGSPVIGECQI